MTEGFDPRGSDAAPRIRPVRRSYGATSGARDVDSFQAVARYRVLSWSLVGAFLGVLVASLLFAQGAAGFWIFPVGIATCWSISYFGPLLILHYAGRAGATLYAPSGKSTPRTKEYSLAESLVVRGLYDEAVAAFQEAIDDDPTDWRPHLRIARMKRDRTSDHEGAAAWFRRAVTETEMPSGTRLLVLKEYVELCELRLNAPGKAAPLLARVADQDGDSAAGRWARETLTRIKRELAQEHRSA